MKTLFIDQVAKTTYKYSFSIVNALTSFNIDVTIAIDQLEDTSYCKCKCIRMFNTDEKNIGKLKKITNYIRSLWRIYNMIFKDDYDILHTQWIIFSPIDYLLMKSVKKRGKKIVFTIHDILPFNEKFYDKYFYNKIYGNADEVIVQAAENVNRFVNLYPSYSKKLTMIPHGHYLDFAEIVSVKEARNHLAIPENAFVFLFFGLIKKVKGLNILLEAFSKVKNEIPNAFLVIAGCVWKTNFGEYQRIIDKYHMWNQVKTDIFFIPDCDIKYYYCAADICVLPYLDSFQSGVVQLSYAYGKAVIASDLKAFQLVKEEETGFVCNPNDPESLSKKMLKSYINKDNLESMGQKGILEISRKYDWNKIAYSLKEVYTKALD